MELTKHDHVDVSSLASVTLFVNLSIAYFDAILVCFLISFLVFNVNLTL